MEQKAELKIEPREEYKPDLATRLAIEKARREQPPLLSLSSRVPGYRSDGG